MSGSFRAAAGALLVLATASCTPAPPRSAGPARYVVGGGYQLGGTWFYPREDFRYDATGVAGVLPDRGRVTANGESYDPGAMVAAHQTLQLPALVRVTNLENGAQVLVRVNDRGPASPGRVIALSPRAAGLLGIRSTAPVRVQVEEAGSTALREQLGGTPRLAVAAAPRTGVRSESLAPPPGIAQSSRGRPVTDAVREGAEAPAESADRVPDRLSETVTRVPAAPGTLNIHAGSFGQAQYAQRLASRFPEGRVERRRDGRAERFEVVAGPFSSVAQADAALDRALRAGVSDARISVD